MMSSTTTQLTRTKRRYCDKFTRGNKDTAENFIINNLQRINAATTRFTQIYNAYIDYMQRHSDIPISREVFMVILKTKGYELMKRGKILYLAATIIEKNLETQSDPLDGLDIDAINSIESFKSAVNKSSQNLWMHEPMLFGEISNKEKEKQEEDRDNIKMKQIDIVENFAEIAKLEFEEKLKKLDKLKEELIDKNINSVELLDRIKEILK